jgi:ankyrin repeat protein
MTTELNESDDDDSFSSSAAEQIENFVHNLCNLHNLYVMFGSNNNPAKESPTNPLSDAIRRHDWQAAIKILKGKPSLAKATSSCDGMIPLHLACDEGAPENIIKMLLQAYPQAAHTKCGEQNRLPIHYHLASKVESIPSETIVSLLIESFPESTRAGDANNQLPIHLACQATQVSGNIFALLLSSFPEGACARDVHGNYPCDYATWNEDGITKEIALTALVQNDATQMRRTWQYEGKSLSNPRIFDTTPSSARTQRRKRLNNEVTFSMLNSYDELYQ